ncbi:LysM peptidoglycan-binding domain-containing protein [bacterium SCSIO 12643]|nr:LysM peptidoglycan-binding domain-containing protein [bacterium SCSIO 12643]
MEISAQEPATIKTDGLEYIIHVVKKGETLYAISKKYSVSVEDIKSANQDIEEFGIRIGQSIRIPMNKVNKKEAKKSEVEISGDTIYHEVLKKETLYALTKKYEISTEELIKLNPELEEGLKIGMRLKIPVIPSADSTSTEVDFQMPEEDSLLLHTVQPKETLYALSQKYGVSSDSIQMVNNGLSEGLQIGSTIRIPILNPNYVKDKDTTQVIGDSLTRVLLVKDTIRVGVFLPFCTAKNLKEEAEEEAVEENEEKEAMNLYGLTKISLDFMRGYDLAMDSLRSLGFYVEVDYYDTQNDTNVCKEILAKKELESYHLFVGPLFQTNFKLFADQAKKLGVPIVSPVKISSRLLLDNKYVIKSYASSPAQIIRMSKYMGRMYADSTITVIYGGAQKDKRYAQIFQKYLSNTVGDSIPIHRIWQPSVYNFKKYMKQGAHNYVAVISSDEAFVSSSMSAFYGFEDESTQVSVLGIDSWQKFSSIDFDYLMGLDVTYPAQQFVDYQDEKVIQVIEKYRALYFTDPSNHTWSAFDIGMYFVPAIYESKGNWQDYIENHKNEGLSFKMDFVKIGEDSGYENQGGFILRNHEYQLNLAE